MTAQQAIDHIRAALRVVQPKIIEGEFYMPTEFIDAVLEHVEREANDERRN